MRIATSAKERACPQIRGLLGKEFPLEHKPPLPAKVTLSQAKHFATSLIRGEPNRQKIALTVLGDRVRELV